MIKQTPLVIYALLLLAMPASPGAAVANDRDTPHGTLLLEDAFDRDESVPEKEDIGNGWTSNSAWRAKGYKQVDLADGAMHVTRHPEADHGVAIFHQVAFQDGAVELKFKLGAGDDLGLDFVDRELKTVHAGHLCMAKITLKGLTIMDSKTGHMDLKVRGARLAGDKSPELTKLIQSKRVNFPLSLEAEKWYTLRVVVEGDVMRVSLDGKVIGDFQSEGIAHPTKRMITLAVNKSAWVDDIKVWKRK